MPVRGGAWLFFAVRGGSYHLSLLQNAPPKTRFRRSYFAF